MKRYFLLSTLATLASVSLSLAQDSRPIHVRLAEDNSWFQAEDRFSLQSDPEAEKVIYLSFEVDDRKDSAYVVDEFLELAEDYWPWHVNVTTDIEVYNKTSLENKLRFRYNPGLASQYGAQCIGDSFGKQEGQDKCLLKGKTHHTAAHEIGHGLGLNHDYSWDEPGLLKGSKNFVPIMGGSGASRYQTFWHLTPMVLRLEDDFRTIGKHLEERDDKIPATMAGSRALILSDNGQIIPDSNWSTIEPPIWNYDPKILISFSQELAAKVDHNDLDIDQDMWAFTTQGGLFYAEITPTVTFNNLHVQAKLFDKDSNLVVASTPLANGHTIKQAASFNIQLDSGLYFLQIEPTGAADNSEGIGYPVYGSVGYYQIEGTVNGSVGINSLTYNSLAPISWSLNGRSLSVQANGVQSLHTRMYNIQGQSLISTSNTEIDLSHLQAGKYFLEFRNGQGSTMVRSIILP